MTLCRRTFALLVTLMLVAPAPSIAHACDCPLLAPAAARAAASVVFEGEVLSIGPSAYANRPCGGLCPDTEVRFRVTRSWKGRPPRELVVHTHLASDCGYEFRVGTTYLVYASGSGPYVTDLCTRTAPIANAGEDLRVLGRGARVR